MLLLRLWNYLRGYVIIVVEGYFLEKFVNICIHRQIFLWDMKRNKESTLTLKISIKGFKSLRPIARRTKCRVRIKSKKGLPFLLSRYKRRKAFILGSFLFILLFYTMTSFIWSIELTGNKKLDQAYIMESLDKNGIRPGVIKYGIDPDKVVNNMMLEIDELSWISVSIKGTRAKIQVEERTIAPELVPKNDPCNIIAKRDGIIKSLTVKDGYEMVKIGDTVVKGQVLVSGTIPIKDEPEKVRNVHSIASVMARTWYEESIPVQTRVVEKIKTGKKKDHYSLLVFTNKLKLLSGRIEFADYDKIEMRKPLSLGKDLILPFGIIIDRYYEEKTVEAIIDIEDAKKLAADKALEVIMEDVPPSTEILETYVNFIQENENELVAKVTVECLEEIGIKAKIGGE